MPSAHGGVDRWYAVVHTAQHVVFWDPKDEVRHMTTEFYINDKLYLANDPALDVIATFDTRKFWRTRGGGPPFIKVTPGACGRVLYSGRDLNEFLAKRRVAVEA